MRFFLVATACLLALTGCGGSDQEPAAKRNTHAISQAPSTKAGTPTPRQSPASAPASRWGVVGVVHDDQLNVRSRPDASAPVLARLSPTATSVEVTTRRQGEWRQVKVDGQTGWAHGRYLAQFGEPADATQEARAAGIAPTRAEVVRVVARRMGGEGSKVTTATTGRKPVVDVLGVEDDSLLGTRLRLVIVPGEAGFEVRRATAQPICARGVTAQGQCR